MQSSQRSQLPFRTHLIGPASPATALHILEHHLLVSELLNSFSSPPITLGEERSFPAHPKEEGRGGGGLGGWLGSEGPKELCESGGYARGSSGIILHVAHWQVLILHFA